MRIHGVLAVLQNEAKLIKQLLTGPPPGDNLFQERRHHAHTTGFQNALLPRIRRGAR
jgi:hypothetical protein